MIIVLFNKSLTQNAPGTEITCSTTVRLPNLIIKGLLTNSNSKLHHRLGQNLKHIINHRNNLNKHHPEHERVRQKEMLKWID